MSIHWPGSPMYSNASYRGAPSGTNWTRCCHGTGKRPKLRKPATPRSVCVRSFAKHPGCCATGTDHAKAQVDPPLCILPSEDHTPPEPSNVGRVQRLPLGVGDDRTKRAFTVPELVILIRATGENWAPNGGGYGATLWDAVRLALLT